MAEKDISINVCGESFSLASSNDEEYVNMLAQYVDGKLEEINRARKGSYLKASLKTALLTLNLADDVFRERKKNEELALRNEQLEKELRKR